MKRFLFFLITLILPLIFGWWLFLPLSIFFIYLSKTPYELILAGAILDRAYYFGEGFLRANILLIFSFLAVLAAIFLSGRIQWQRKI